MPRGRVRLELFGENADVTLLFRSHVFEEGSNRVVCCRSSRFTVERSTAPFQQYGLFENLQCLVLAHDSVLLFRRFSLAVQIPGGSFR